MLRMAFTKEKRTTVQETCLRDHRCPQQWPWRWWRQQETGRPRGGWTSLCWWRTEPSCAPQWQSFWLWLSVGWGCCHGLSRTAATKRHSVWEAKEAAIHWTWNLKLTRLLSWTVQSVPTFQHHVHCIVGKSRDFLNLKINTNNWPFLRLWVTRAWGGLMDSLAHQD